MDLFIIHGIVEELRRELTGGLVNKVFQVNRADLLLRIWRPGEEKELFISTHPDDYRLHLTRKKFPHPPAPPRFCAYLRKHILGARIQEIRQDPYERVVRFFLQKKLSADILRSMTLVLELTGKMSNVLLLEGERILDCLHFHKAQEGIRRPQIPGIPYVPPQPKGWSLPEVTLEKMEEVFDGKERPFKALAQRVSGLGLLLAQEIDFISEKTPAGYLGGFRFLLERYAKHAFEPCIVSLPTGKKILSPFLLRCLGPSPPEVFPSLNQAADVYYFETVVARQMDEEKRTIRRRLKQLISRLQKRREHLLKDREKFQGELEAKIQGEMLLSHYGRIKKGMLRVEVQDLRKDPPGSMIIPLDPALDAAGNVDRYFRKYKKAKRGLAFLAERLEKTDQEIAYLESALFQVEEAEDTEALTAIRKELEAERVLPPQGKEIGRKEKGEVSMPVRRFRSSDGLDIFCGKHNVGNDYLLRHLTKGNDLWFHAQGTPGSHVLLKVGQGDPPLRSILEAATVAALYSRGRHSTRLPVDYTAARNVHRPKGARPGYVTYTQQRTVFVVPDKQKVQKLVISDR